MTYQIGPCNSPHDIYETRTYRCLGHWVDKKSTNVYTLTKRVDVVNSYECFAGLMANTEEGKIYIREAGEGGNCYKEILDVKSFGMEMNRTGEFYSSNLLGVIYIKLPNFNAQENVLMIIYRQRERKLL